MAPRQQRVDDERKSGIMAEARRRFRRVQTYESQARARFTDDLKFCEGDSDNLWQWPQDIRDRLEGDLRPMLTINKTKQHCLDIENDARQSRVAIKVRATGGGASVESAQVFGGIIRHIEYISNAATAYQNGMKFQVRGGIGYWRVVTDYANDDSFDQELFIRRILNPLTVYMDPDIVEFDGSDAKYAFIFTDMPKEEFDLEYPEWKNRAANNSLGADSWVTGEGVRIAEYFRRVQTKDRLLAYPDPSDKTGKTLKMARASELPKDLVRLLDALDTTKSRPIKSHRVEWFRIIGDNIVEERDWPGVYIPVVRCVGEETVIDKQLDRKGHTRALKDAQRMFNYNASGSVEFGALQSKTPYMAPADAIEGFEEEWETANTENPSVLPWNHRDDDGKEIPEPKRQDPPRGAPLYMEGMRDAAEWMRMVSGQYQADMGAPSNERSGAAINARQRQGDNATFHFLDHQAIAIRFTAKILLDLIPKIYDSERVVKILAEDGKESTIRIDPDQKEAMQKMEETREAVAAIFNPSVGKYDVMADVGPAFATQRQEAFNAYTQILAQNKELTGLIGDIALRFADFPGAEEAAERLRRMVPQQAMKDGPAPDLVAAQNQIASLNQLIQNLATKLADKTAAHANDQEKAAISAYDAQTKRLAALKDALNTSPERLVELVRQVIEEAEATSGLGLSPALTRTPPVTAQDMLPPPQAGGAPPPGGMDHAGGLPENGNPDDMGAGPAAAAGGAPAPAG